MMIFCNDSNYWYEVHSYLIPFLSIWGDGLIFFSKAMLKIAYCILKEPEINPENIGKALEYFESSLES